MLSLGWLLAFVKRKAATSNRKNTVYVVAGLVALVLWPLLLLAAIADLITLGLRKIPAIAKLPAVGIWVAALVVVTLGFGALGSTQPPAPSAAQTAEASAEPAASPSEDPFAALTAPSATPESSARQTPEPSPTATPKPTPKPTVNPDSVEALKPIPGLTQADLKLNLQNQGFNCEGPNTFLDGVEYICTWTDGLADYRVEWVGLTPGDIRTIDASVLWYGSGSGESSFDWLLGYVATVPYSGSKPNAAQAWVQTAKKGTKNFGPATYRLTSAKTGRYRDLQIEAK